MEEALARSWLGIQGAAAACRGCASVPRLAAEPLNQYLGSSKVASNAKSVVASVACNATWTQARRFEAGLIDDPTCLLCKAARDDMFHRIWTCPAVEDKRREVVPPWLLQEALRGEDRPLLFTRGWMPHPAGSFWQSPAGISSASRANSRQ